MQIQPESSLTCSMTGQCASGFSQQARLVSPTIEELIEELNRAEREWRLYSLRARLLTGIFRHRWFPIYGSDFQLDHKYSIRWGYLNSVPLEVISNRSNLALVRTSYNLRKGSKCSISLSELWEGYLPDPQLSKMTNLVVKAEEETLARWGLIADHRFRQSRRAIAEQASGPNQLRAPEPTYRCEQTELLPLPNSAQTSGRMVATLSAISPIRN